MISARSSLAGAGTQTAALAFGGRTPAGAAACTEAYNGGTWATKTGLITPRYSLAGAGTQTASLAFGGYCTYASYPTVAIKTEAYNGGTDTWSNCANMNVRKYGNSGAGTTTSALVFGGVPAITCTETWNGSTWSTGNAMITGGQGMGGVGTATAALAISSGPSNKCVQGFNGISWSTRTSLIAFNGRSAGAAAGTTACAISFGGSSLACPPATVACSETFTG
jgi:hypothetical protein